MARPGGAGGHPSRRCRAGGGHVDLCAPLVPPMTLSFASPPSPSPLPSASPSASQLQEILELYENGQTLKAWAVARECGPLKDWQGTAARVLAGRLAGQLGAQRLARALHWT